MANPVPFVPDPAGQKNFEDLDKRLGALEGLPKISRGTFPSAPTDGALHFYEVVEGVTWQFVYNAGSASSYKWEFVGGSPRWDETDNSGSVTSGTYVALANGTTLVAPLAGDYIYRAYVNLVLDSFDVLHAKAATSTPANDTGSSEFYSDPAMTLRGPVAQRLTGLSASASVALYVRTAFSTPQWRSPRAELEPIRVAG